MSAVYTESKFNACLDAISSIRRQRDSAIRVADALLQCLYPCQDRARNCDICLLRDKLDEVKADVIAYQKELQAKSK
jgi:hypothetical protein